MKRGWGYRTTGGALCDLKRCIHRVLNNTNIKAYEGNYNNCGDMIGIKIIYYKKKKTKLLILTNKEVKYKKYDITYLKNLNSIYEFILSKIHDFIFNNEYK